MSDFVSEGAAIVGLSADSIASHERFLKKNGLRVILLSDPSKNVIQGYGAWGRKKMYGKEYEGIVRSTFLIDPAGVVRWIWPSVKVEGHAEDVLETLRRLKRQK